MIELLLTCSLLSSVSFELDTIQDIKRVSQQCELVEEVQEWIPLITEHFHTEDEALALTVVYCESRGYPKAVNVNKDGSLDRGLFQFNTNTEAWLEKDIFKRDLDIFNPKINIRTAAWLVLNDGWHHWNASKHCWGKYDKSEQ